MTGALHNADLAFDFALRIYGCPRLIRLEDLFSLDEHSVFSYLSLLKQLVDRPIDWVRDVVLHSVTLIGDAAALHSAVIGRRIEGKWLRWRLEKSGEPQTARKTLSPVEMENIFILIYDFETKEHIPIEVEMTLVADNEVLILREYSCSNTRLILFFIIFQVIFGFIADEIGTKVIEVYYTGERVGATYVEVDDISIHFSFFLFSLSIHIFFIITDL